jgi:hypothetical protein
MKNAEPIVAPGPGLTSPTIMIGIESFAHQSALAVQYDDVVWTER